MIYVLFISELQNQGRKKRDLKPAEPDFFSETQMPNRENNFEDSFENKFEDKTNFDYREAVLAAHSLFRGFSNALAAADSQNKHVTQYSIYKIIKYFSPPRFLERCTLHLPCQNSLK